MDKSIHDLIREMEEFDKTGTTNSSKYVSFSMREDIEKTEAYLNSKHISGETDYLGREKPFFNIVTAAANIWFRATDIDRKNIIIRATKDIDEIPALLATLKLQEWMKKQKFGEFLNDWGLTLARHGSAITKFIERDGELHASVMDWNTMLVDAVDFDNNVKVEKLWLTPAQLRKNKSYDKELVKKLLENTTTRKTSDGTQKDTKSNYILVYEVHGELPLELLTDNEDDSETYVQQVHVVTFIEKRDDRTGDRYFDDYTLYKGREAKDPYLLSHLLKKEGQTYSGGAVKNLFDAQWMINHTQKQIKDQLDLASKIVFQTSDETFVGQNVLMNIENGDILHHKPNEGLTMLNNRPDIAAMQSFKADWQNISNQINGISEAMMGVAPKAGTAWRQTQALLQESHSLFEIMTENKGLAIIEMMTDYVIPFFKKQLDNTEEISMVLEDHQLKQIDSRYIPNEVNRRVNQIKKQTILNGQIYDPANEPADIMQAENEVRQGLQGNQRFIKPSEVKNKTWKELFKDLEWKLDIDITGENKDTQGIIDTLNTALTTVARNPMILQDPNAKMIFNKILRLSGGISPLEITDNPPQQMPQMPQLEQQLQANPMPQ